MNFWTIFLVLQVERKMYNDLVIIYSNESFPIVESRCESAVFGGK